MHSTTTVTTTNLLLQPLLLLLLLLPLLLLNKNNEPSGSISFSSKAIVNKTVLADISGITDEDGLGEMALQWQSSSDNSNWSDIAGAITDQFSIQNSDFNESGS